jgi:large subunit ribosomal protein L21
MVQYAIISLGGKQYVVREGEKFLVDRLETEEGKTFQPDVLFVGGEGDGEVAPSGTAVTAKVIGHERGPKIVIGKYRRRTGYKRHTGFRASLSRIEITTIGGESRERAAARTEAPPTEVEVEVEAPAAAPETPVLEPETPAVEPETPKGMPRGYEEMTVAQVSEGAKTWNRPMLEAALAYEQEHAERKGAIAALESALAAKETT